MAKKIDSLQYLRAFAALWVLLTHVLQQLKIKPGGILFAGQWGVDIFFLLSGFIIYLTTKDHSSWKAFAIKRVFRIYPAYLVCLVVYASYSIICNVKGGGYNAFVILQNVLMLPFSGPIGYKSLIVEQAWSTCYEMYFYFLLAILLVIGISKKWLLPIILSLFILCFSLNRIHPMDGFVGYLYSLIGKHYVLFFCEGILIAMLHEKIHSFKMKQSILTIVSIVSLVVYIVMLCHPYRWVISLVLSPVFFTIVYKMNEILPDKGIVHRMMLTMGNISFSTYLIHLFVIRFFFNQCHVESLVWLLLCTLAATIILSLLCYNLIENRFIDFGKKLSSKL